MCSTALAVSSFFASEQANNAAEARTDNNSFFIMISFSLEFIWNKYKYLSETKNKYQR
jgi:hypothetical protein